MIRGTYITADWCQPCKAYKPVAERVFREMGLVLIFLDVEEPFVKRFYPDVASVPTIIIHDGSEEVERLTGAFPESRLRERLERLIG